MRVWLRDLMLAGFLGLGLAGVTWAQDDLIQGLMGAADQPVVGHSSNSLERLLLEVTTSVTFASSSKPNALELDEELRTRVLNVYYDQYSGFQAYKVEADLEGRPVIIYAFGATQLFERGNGEDRLSIDVRDWMANMGYALPQIESLGAAQMLADIQRDAANGTRVYLSGQSLGGMNSHVLGYLAKFQLIEQGQRSAIDNIHVINWAIPGMTSVLQDYMKKYRGIRNYQLDRTITASNFLTIHYEIDILPTMGVGWGLYKVIPVDVLALEMGERYAFDIPFIRQHLESHLYEGFDRALNRDGIPVETSEARQDRFTPPPFFRFIMRAFSYSVLDSMYKNFLKKHGTAQEWQRCYDAGHWQTNLTRRCESREEFGCQVGVTYRYSVTGSRIQRRERVDWCMPPVNPISQRRGI